MSASNRKTQSTTQKKKKQEKPIMPLWLSSLPADISVSAISSGVAAATVTAATFFLICKSHLCSHKENLKTLQQEQPKRNPRGKIMFVSRVSYSEAKDRAKRLSHFLESKGLVLEVVDGRNYDLEELPKENLILLLHSTSRDWKQPCFTDDSKGAKAFASWLVHNAESFGSGAVVVKACSFTVLVVGKRDGKNLMAKAANLIRDFDHAVQYNDDFDEWWGSVVATVSGDTVANGMCRESELEDDVGCSDPKSIYMLVENVDVVDRKKTFRRRMLTINEANFVKNGSVDLEDGGPVIAEWPLAHDLIIDSRLPTLQGFCSLGGSLFIAGGIMCNNNGPKFEFELELQHFLPAKMWCLKYDGLTWIWSLCGSMIYYRMNPIVVPYHGKLCIFGGNTRAAYWVEIYDEKTDLWEKREVPEVWCLWDTLKSYFLWEDRTEPHQKTLIMFYFSFGKDQWFVSYDFEANLWKSHNCELPPTCDCPRKIIRLACSDYLLIVDSADMWYIYDFSKKELVADVHVNGLEELTGRVSYVFCCHYTSEESLIYVFMEVDEKVVEEHGGDPDLVPYARVKLQTRGNFSTKVESMGNLKVGPYSKLYMFAVRDQDIELKGRL